MTQGHPRRLGADHLATTNAPGVGAKHLCTRHGYLREGGGWVGVWDRGHYYRACFYCLNGEEAYSVEEAKSARAG